MQQAGDWICPSCNVNNFASRLQCFKCSQPKDGHGGGMMHGFNNRVKPGDWECHKCRVNNFASRNVCFKCNAPKMDPRGYGGYNGNFFGGGGGMGGGMGGGNSVKPGDWQCKGCSVINYAKRDRCFQCAAEKADAMDVTQQFGGGAFGGKFGGNRRIGDWTCSGCQGHNFSSRTQCFKCGTPKQDGDEQVQEIDMGGFQQRPAFGGNVRPGDWTCVCGFNNFASRNECFKCQTHKQL